MENLLEACIELDTLAVEVYALFATGTEDDSLRQVFLELKSQESDHISWWLDAQQRVDSGAVVIPIGSAKYVTTYMKAIATTFRSMLGSAAPRALNDDDRLALAASLEFFALDPVFSLLIHASDPLLGAIRNKAYDEHVELLLTTMEARSSWLLDPHVAMLRIAKSESDTPAPDHLHDPVTGLPLRGLAENAIDALCQDSARDGHAISLAIIDLSLHPLYVADPIHAERTLLRITFVMTSLLRFTDLMVRLDDGHKFAVVMPATSSSVASAKTAALAGAAAGVAAAATGGEQSSWATSAVVTLPPGPARCGAASAFLAAEALLGDAHSSGKALAVSELV
jgi:GGDEF domain-containing protein